MYQFTMPRLSLTMEAGTIRKWVKKEGEEVKKGETLVIVETEKVTVEIESPVSGIVRKIIALEDEEVPVAETLAIIGEANEPLPDLEKIIAKTRASIKKPKGVVTVEAERPMAVTAPAEVEVKISPLAKKLAEEYKVDLTKIKGTGPGGRIVKEDILKAVEAIKAPPAPPAPVAPAVAVTPTPPKPERARVIPLAGIRKTIAKRMLQSVQTAPQLTITMEVDMSEIVKLRQQILPEIEKMTKVRVTYTDILVKAVAKVLKEFPLENARLEGDQIKLMEDINIGVAVALEDGLIVPVVHNADKKSLVEIALKVDEIVKKAREGRLSIEEVTGGTFTITNLGMFGVDVFTPIINPPESAILGVGRIVERPVVVNGQITIRPMTVLSLTFDHRITDGAQAAQFCQRLKQILENPHIMHISH